MLILRWDSGRVANRTTIRCDLLKEYLVLTLIYLRYALLMFTLFIFVVSDQHANLVTAQQSLNVLKATIV